MYLSVWASVKVACGSTCISFLRVGGGGGAHRHVREGVGVCPSSRGAHACVLHVLFVCSCYSLGLRAEMLNSSLGVDCWWSLWTQSFVDFISCCV